MHVILPTEFSYLTKNPKIFFKKKTLKTDYIIHLINYCLIYKDDTEFPLNSTMMRHLYSKNYPLIVKYLVSKDFIRKVRNHEAGANSRIYTVCFPFTCFTTPFQLFNHFLKDKWEKHQKHFILSLPELKTSILPELRKPLIDNLYQVDIDAVKATKWIESGITQSQTREFHFLKIEAINSKDIHYSFDDYGRFHSSFTNLKKELRQFLQVDGKKLLDLDIKTSQPLFLAQILKNYNGLGTYDRFIDITENQDIYLFLLNKNPQYLKSTIDESRKAIKTDILTSLFDPQKTTAIPYNKLFNDEFPEVYTFVKRYKKYEGEFLWKTLQRLESNFLYNSIFKKIKDLNLFCITIHDSIFFQTKDKKVIEKIWYKELEKLKNSL
jgi:hypothetical protein